MTFPSGLKRICDISFYMTFASIVGSIFGGDNLISTLPIFAFAAFLSAFLAPLGGIKYVSILPLLLVFVPTPLTIINVAILSPIILFIIWTLPTRDEKVSMFNYDEVFKRFLMIFGTILVFSIFIGELQSGTLLFAISFLLNSIIFMRLIRHDESVLKQTEFTIRNAVSIIVVMIGAVLLSMDVFLTFVGRIIRFIFVNFFVPVLEITIWTFLTILQFIFETFGLNDIINRFLRIENEIPELLGAEYQPITEGLEGSDFPLIFIFIIVIAAIVLIYFIIKVFQTLTRLKSPFASYDVEEERFFLDDDEKKGRSRRRGENKVREVYRRFLTLIKKQETNVPLRFTSSDVDGLVATKFKSEKSSALRDEYIQVRYGESLYTKADIKRIKGLYKEVKGEIERQH